MLETVNMHNNNQLLSKVTLRNVAYIELVFHSHNCHQLKITVKYKIVMYIMTLVIVCYTQALFTS